MNTHDCILHASSTQALILRLMRLLLLWSAVLWAGSSAAQTPLPEMPSSLRPTPAEPARTISAELIETRKKQAASDVSLDEATKEKISDLYDQALEALKRADMSTVRAQTLRQDVDAVQARKAQVQQRLDELRAASIAIPSGMSLPELVQELAKVDLRLAELKQKYDATEAEPSVRANRRREVRNLLFSIPTQIDTLEAQLDAAPPRDEPAQLTTARQSELLARCLALEREIPALQNELAKYDAEDAVDLLRLVRDTNAQEVASAERLFQLLDERVKRLRDDSAREVVRQAEAEAFRALPLLKDYSEKNRELAEQTQQLTQLTSDTDDKLQLVRADLEDIEHRFTQARERFKNVGMTRSVGAQLRKLKATLPDVRRRRQDIRNRQQTIEDVRFQSFELDDERSLLAKPETVIEQILATAPPETSNAEREQLREAARASLDRKREYLDGLIRIQSVYFDSLTTLDIAEQKLVNLTDEYVSYINERVLWIRSGQSLTKDYSLSATNLWIVSPTKWLDVNRRLQDDMRTNPITWIVIVVLFTALIFKRRRMRHMIAEIGQLAARPSCTQFRLTGRATGLTLLLAVTWPLLCWFIAWRLKPGAGPFGAAVATGLSVQASAFFVLETLRQVCRRQGLAETHFGWPASAIQTLRTSLASLIAIALPLVFLTSVLYASDPEQGTGVLERIGFIATSVIVSVSLARVIRPGGGLLKDYLARHRDGWLDRLRYVWYWSIVAAPLTLAALAYFGYVYTVHQLSMQLFSTFSLIVLLVVIREMLLRLLLVHRRQLSIHQARERRAAALAALKAEQGTGSYAHSQSMIPIEEVTDLAQSSVQVKRIVTTLAVVAMLIGLWAIWADVIPALRFLDNWGLWTTVDQVTQDVSDPGEEPVLETRDVLRVVTVADVMLSLLVCVTTWVAFAICQG